MTPSIQRARRTDDKWTSPIILCIDDDAQMRNILRLRMKDMGIEVRRAPSGRDGVRLARTERPDLILTDWSMGRGDGEHVLRRLRECDMTRDVPVVVISGQYNAMIDELGADAFLQKPFSYSDLRSVLGRFVRLRGSMT